MEVMIIGESIALMVALSWTVTALFAEVASKRMGSLPLNVVRMSMSLVLLALTLWLTTGAPYPCYADGATWLWLLASGVVGYVIGDYCLMQCYIYIGSRLGQLFMTLSAPTAAIVGRLLLGERMQPLAVVGMVVTLSGIAMAILSKKDDGESHTAGGLIGGVRLRLPLRGVVYASIAGICQGFGLVLSKQGLLHYHTSVAAAGLDAQEAVASAVVGVPIEYVIPFSATFIRAAIGLVGFWLMLLALHRDARQRMEHALRDRKAMWCVFGATVFGPFIGVSASLLATLYTTTGIAQTIFALTPILIIVPSVVLMHQRVTLREVVGAVVCFAGVALFFVR